MSTQDRNQHALQRVVKYLAPRLYENEPPAANSERALRALTGVLASNPPFVIDAFDLDVPGSAYIWDVAISPTGKIAIVVGIPEERTGCSNALLTTWPRPSGYSEFHGLGPVDDDTTVRALFPEGSKTPAVIFGGRLIGWGNWTLELPWAEEKEVPKDACLTLWEDRDHLQHVAYLNEGEIVYEMNVVGAYSKPAAQNVRWIGLVGGKLGYIQVKNGHDELHWNYIQAKLPEASHKILPGSISVIDDDVLQFVTQGKAFTAFLATRDSLTSSDPMHICVWGDGHIFGYPYRADTDRDPDLVYEFDMTGHWVPVAKLDYDLFRDVQQLFVEGEHFTLVNPNVHGVGLLYVGHAGDLSVRTIHISQGPKTGFARAHSGIIYQTDATGLGGFVWSALDNPPHKRPLTAVFPNYGRFDQLVPVQDDRGKAIMGWGYAEGTFCVIRCPLPSR